MRSDSQEFEFDQELREAQRHLLRLYEPAERLKLLLLKNGANVKSETEAIMVATQLLHAFFHECRKLRERVERGD